MMAEALAIRDGLELAKDVGYRKIWVESDNIPVVKLMNELGGFRWPLARIWHDVQELRRSFSHFSLDFVNREANVAAHCCAKFANLITDVVSLLELLGQAHIEILIIHNNSQRLIHIWWVTTF
jgi:ribonuclease HI